MRRYMVLVETSGNQRYIFATDKRRENVGASDLIDRVAREWGENAIQRARKLGHDVQVHVAAAGKLLFHMDDGVAARDIVREVTLTALHEAPGLDVAGVVCEFESSEVHGLRDASRAVHRQFQEARAGRPGPDTRFLQLPLVERCGSSGMPAFGFEPVGGRDEPRSAASLAKLRAVRHGAYERLAECIGVETWELEHEIVPILASAADDDNTDESDAFRPDRKEDDAGDGRSRSDAGTKRVSWVAVVHADGNALGEVFRSLDDPLDDPYRFSTSIDRCTKWAFRRAVIETWGGADGELPLILPLVLGGDDLTVLCDGQCAVDFAIHFLRAFEGYVDERHVADDDIAASECIRTTMTRKGKRMTASAGVAIVKPHYPFSAAHELASELASSAKRVRQPHQLGCPASSLDFHVLYDSTASELDAIRERLRVDGAELTAKPYVVLSDALVGSLGEANRRWAEQHDIEGLRRRVGILERGRVADGDAALPSAQVQQLREALFAGIADANERFEVLLARHAASGVAALGNVPGDGRGHSLFWEESMPGQRARTRRTAALDAIDAVGFLMIDAPVVGLRSVTEGVR